MSTMQGPHRTSLDTVRRGLTATRPWGRLEITPESELSMLRRGALVMRVYPPGATRRERFLLGARYRLISSTGLALLILLSVTMAATLSACTPLRPFSTWLISVAGLFLTAGTVIALSNRAASKVRSVRFPLVIIREGKGRAGVHIAARDDERFKVLVAQVRQLDSSAQLSPVDYELLWGRLYDHLRADPVGT